MPNIENSILEFKLIEHRYGDWLVEFDQALKEGQFSSYKEACELFETPQLELKIPLDQLEGIYDEEDEEDEEF